MGAESPTPVFVTLQVTVQVAKNNSITFAAAISEMINHPTFSDDELYGFPTTAHCRTGTAEKVAALRWLADDLEKATP